MTAKKRTKKMSDKKHIDNAAKQKAYRERNQTTPKKPILTQQQKDKRREDKLFNFAEVRLHLIYCNYNDEYDLRENGFNFKYRPKREDIYFNFYEIDTKEDYLLINSPGVFCFFRGQQNILDKIDEYVKQYPTVKVIDERTPDQIQFKPIPEDRYGDVIFRETGKEANYIIIQCKKHPYSVCRESDERTQEQLFIEETKNPFNNNKYFPGIEEERLRDMEYMFGEHPLPTNNEKPLLFDINGKISPLNELAGFNVTHSNALPVFADVSGVLC